MFNDKFPEMGLGMYFLLDCSEFVVVVFCSGVFFKNLGFAFIYMHMGIDTLGNFNIGSNCCTWQC